MFFSTSSSKKLICSSLICCDDLVDLILNRSYSTHLKNTSIWKLTMLIFFSPAVKSSSLLSSSTKYMLKLTRSFNDFVEKGKQRWLLLFISFWSLKVAFIQVDLPFISSQLSILLRSIITNNPYILLFNRTFFTSFNSLRVINICFVSFLTEAGNNRPSGVYL